MDALEKLPERIDGLESQIVQLRTEMRVEFSAIQGQFAAVRDQFAAVQDQFAVVQDQFASVHERFVSVDSQFAWVREQFSAVWDEFAAVRREIRDGDEETRRLVREMGADLRTHMLVLHEEVIGRIGLLGEGRPPVRPRRRKPPTDKT